MTLGTWGPLWDHTHWCHQPPLSSCALPRHTVQGLLGVCPALFPPLGTPCPACPLGLIPSSTSLGHVASALVSSSANWGSGKHLCSQEKCLGSPWHQATLHISPSL